jgi:hypothetical protein
LSKPRDKRKCCQATLASASNMMMQLLLILDAWPVG